MPSASSSFCATMAAGSFRDAVDFLLLALDGYQPAVGGAIPVAAPFPAGSFPTPVTAPASIDSGGRPVFALGSQIGSGLLDALKPALSAIATAAANPSVTPPAPTHIGIGVRGAHQSGDGRNGNPRDRHHHPRRPLPLAAALRRAHSASPQTCNSRSRQSRQSEWLADRRFERHRRSWPSACRRSRAMGRSRREHLPRRRHQGRSHRQSAPGLLAWASRGTCRRSPANAQALLGAVLQRNQPAGARHPVAAGILLSTLQALKLAVADIHGGIGISADAFNATCG